MTYETTIDIDETPVSADYLGELDSAWLKCRGAVEGALAEHQERRASATARYQETIDLAWAVYQATVGRPSVTRRRESVASARRAFNGAAAAALREREEALAGAGEQYVSALERICEYYEGAVDTGVSAAATALTGGLDEHCKASLTAA